MKNNRIILPILVIVLLVLAGGAVAWRLRMDALPPDGSQGFDGQRAYQDVLTQMDFGARTAGSPAHARQLEWMRKTLADAGWTVELQETTFGGQPVKNLVARRGAGGAWIILGAHYDSRLIADQDADPTRRSQPVPGANDGASGVAVLTELARSLPADLSKQVWLVMFDAEDNGNQPGWQWIMGSTAFAGALDAKPDAVVIVDMIGDADLNIYKERNSDPAITDQIWAQAAALGYAQFIPEYKFSMVDDHTPFLQKGVPAVDLIDFDYPYWHTSADTADKVSAESLHAVGDTLWHWLTADFVGKN